MPAHNKLVTTINVVPSVFVDADDEVGMMLMPGFVVPLFQFRTRVKILLTVLQSPEGESKFFIILNLTPGADPCWGGAWSARQDADQIPSLL